ncbi:MAG: DUF4129 domain-containing protein [Richelia sp. RM2_1_2]|nr:DUF4129 domain-containing protein [Richelia sp. SM2_1_7]NJN10292.1 DUF4129 domain-containing protein [Richelia sp. RM1_1_1]NJO62690.1 DUF4129 domain-containing protein [Richelia sp. RM2_1_2]
MAQGEFQKTSWDWQVSLFQQKIAETLEYQQKRLLNWLESVFSPFNRILPDISPQWNIDERLLNVLKILFWIALGLFLTWIASQLWREFRPYFYTWWGKINRFSTANGKSSETQLSSTTWLSRSQQLSLQGNYRDACRLIYLAALQYLHEKAILPHKRSRTDGEYLQLLELSATSIQPYYTLITTHEQLCFDEKEIVSDNYEQCQQAYQQIVKG